MAVARRLTLFSRKSFDSSVLDKWPAVLQFCTNKIHCSCSFSADLENKTHDLNYQNSDNTRNPKCPVELEDQDGLVNDSSNLQITEEELHQYPIRRFTGNVCVVKEPWNEDDPETLRVVNKLKTENVLGLDVETTESSRFDWDYERSKRSRVVQIASETDAILWQLKNFTGLPSSLVFFLNSDILKVGHAICDDVVLLKNEFDVGSKNLLDTLPWAIELNCKPLRLDALCAIFLGWRISKKLQKSDWSRNDLFENQIHYATTDAWASLMLYKEMKRVACLSGDSLPLPVASVDDILDTRLLSRRNRRRRHVQSHKSRKNFTLMSEIASKVVE